MTIRSGFFNSINGDRKYDAGRFAEYFNSFIGNGVFPNPSTNLQVISSDNMSVIVRPGRAWINGYILINDDDYILNIDPADGILNRIDRVVARYDVVDREIRLEIKKGSFASDPVPPSLQRDSGAYELAIAEINVNAGIISITQSDITDLRLNTNLCGIVHGTIEQVDTTTLFNQYENWYTSTVEQAETDISDLKAQFQSDFNAWFETVQGILDEDTAGNLLNMINEINSKITENKDPIITTLNEGENEIISNVVTQLELAKHPSANVLGDLGDFEDLNEWGVTGYGILLDSNNKVFGDSSLKIAPINPDFISSVTMDIELDPTKYYMLSTYQKSNKSLIGSGVTIYSYNQDGFVSEMLCKIDLIQSDNFIRVGDVFNGAENITIFIETIGDIDLIAYFDGLMINEITQEEYNKIQAGTLTIDELLQLYPYVGDLNNAIITHQETGSSYNIGKKSGSIYLLEGNNTLSLEGISSIDISYEQNLKGVIYKNVKNISKVTSQLAENVQQIEGNSILYQNEVKYFAHRGLSKIAPENTLPAFEQAGLSKYWGAECDIHQTIDGEWIVIHDPTFDRTTNGTGGVKDNTLAYAKSLTIDAGNKIADYPDTKIPTLKEYLAVCKKYNMIPVIEMKFPGTAARYDSLVNLLDSEGVSSKCILMSFTLADLQEIRNRTNVIPLGYLVNDITQTEIDSVLELKNAFINTATGGATAPNIELAHSQGIKVGVWTVDVGSARDYYINNKVDFITTNWLL